MEISPYFTFGLSFLVLCKWIIKAFYGFRWSHLGAIVSRLLFCIIYGTIVFYSKGTYDFKFFVELGLNLLFLDELINWGASIENELKAKLDKKVLEIDRINEEIKHGK
jgi:hypothetical protein